MQISNIPNAKLGNTFEGVRFSILELCDNNPDTEYTLIGAQITMMLRKNYNTPVVATLSNDTDQGRISVLDPLTFDIVEHIIDYTPGRYVYDILVVFASGVRQTIVGGLWVIENAVTVYNQ